MAHRSNQAVASQEQPAPQGPGDPPPAGRFLIGWTTALLALGVSTAALAAAIWLLRFSIAGFFIDAALAERGAEADFQIVNLELDHAVLSGIRFGSETSPDAAITTLEVRWRWAGLAPHITAIRVVEPRLRLRIDPGGRISAGALDRLSGGPPGQRRLHLPAIELSIEDGEALIEAPFGALSAVFQSRGVLGENFAATARIAETSRAGDATHALERGSAELLVASRAGEITARLTADVARLVWDGAELKQAQVRVMARAPLDLARYDVEAAWRLGALETANISAARLSGAAGLEAATRENSLNPAHWEGQLRGNAASLTLASNVMQQARLDLHAEGERDTGAGRWSFAGDSFTGLAMLAERPSAAGTFRLDLHGNEHLTSTGQVTLLHARLNPQAQARLRAAFPDLPSAPIGPTFARAEQALSAAAERFDLTIPLALAIDETTTRLRVAAPAEARAATGAVLRLSALRADAPALTAQWPGAAVHGAVALELSGGGAPSASLLLDTLDWSPGEPFEADGTLTLADWQAGAARIAADEIATSIAVSPQGEGRIDLRGAARITGPLGEGEVRDMVAGLDLAVLWNPGWRVVPNRGCLPIQLGGIDAAGLSFANGAFALCPLNGALIAADDARNLSGGFSIRNLALNGRMAGPQAQPAHLSAANVIGRFRGRTGDVSLVLEAEQPGLRIQMAEARTLAIAMRRATADARIHDDTWRVDGAFEQGALTDPSLPGSVTTIAGRWSAAPEDGAPIIRITAGEALLTANRPVTENERVLFNPLRLVDVDATLRDGQIDADGAILLEARSRQLASFTAHHDIDEGAGAARIEAPSITFDSALQPYSITERARGMVENVRGAASATADVRWTRDDIAATGTLRADGVSLATATLPVVQDVRGAVYFDDLFALTTPPGQVVTIGLINPGLAAQDGRVQFQLLPEQRVSIERAEFAFARGVLAMTPTVVRLGEDETRIELTLRDVNAADLITSLNIPDLSATGQLEGSFPLRLTRRSAFIDHGVLRAQGEGGTIGYSGSAGANTTGAAHMAFEALRSFRYDALNLTLDGDLNGEVVSSIEFSGHNTGRAVELGAIAPGLGQVTVRGVPFDFNVHITAPLRSLAQTASSITDPGQILERANGGAVPAPAPEPEEAVDPEPAGTR